MKRRLLLSNKKQAFDIWKQLEQSETSGYGSIMVRLWDIFGGDNSPYYKNYVKEYILKNKEG